MIGVTSSKSYRQFSYTITPFVDNTSRQSKRCVLESPGLQVLVLSPFLADVTWRGAGRLDKGVGAQKRDFQSYLEFFVSFF